MTNAFSFCYQEQLFSILIKAVEFFSVSNLYTKRDLTEKRKGVENLPIMCFFLANNTQTSNRNIVGAPKIY